ncbi:maleylpyruvate isomerase family mycothiol-dependent enzyme [Nocardioides sp. CFH 31398]|uniref:maleylpyruvate isomerase family mycothiol-dependent enzyme n=1 Tax=Nocardioides sp. CFH 31398 TaxID=2919579 RepID=UPI001F052645|nr:maleylpyruvate isomerase family mycothiol-dependent enzyme [Nocardioides sp. CFH 31398]MCH1866909.1 maleylpyruvate isomerase family mycothiol-dependent enzyme [Nocardioides sp. CFH 31398]
MSASSPMDLAVAERAELLALLRGLTPEQWAAPSLCEGWSVRDVAVHVVSYDPLTTRQLGGAFVRGGFRVDRVNDLVLHAYDAMSPQSVVDLVARHQRPRGLTAGFGGRIALTDGTIHHQDVRRALGLPRTIPAPQLLTVLDFARTAPTLPARGLTKGLRLVAEDAGYDAGSGPEVVGPGEALLMAMAGRGVALDELAGDGLPVLARRLGA